jgi:hypothetical protein
MMVRLSCAAFVFAAPFVAWAQALVTVADYERAIAQEEARMEALAARIERLEAAQGGDYAANLELAKSNFVITGCNTPAQEEELRTILATHIMAVPEIRRGLVLGKKIPVSCKIGLIGTGGFTTMRFSGGDVIFDKMFLQGSFEDICNDTAPHEASHVVCALLTRGPLPRWADEGLSTIFESYAARRRQFDMLTGAIQRNGGRLPIAISDLFVITEYPTDGTKLLQLYAEGAALIDFLVQRFAAASEQELDKHGARLFVLSLLDDARARGWDRALADLKIPGIRTVDDLSRQFTAWMLRGTPKPIVLEEYSGNRRQLIQPAQYMQKGAPQPSIVPAR